MTSKVGILLTHVGSPDHPTPSAVRRYLKQFLSDRRVVKISPWLWWPILHGIILRIRPARSAKLYQQIWMETGSPLLHFSNQIAKKLSDTLKLPVELGMHYGNPSIRQALDNFRLQQISKIIVLPLFPQYSATTTAVTFDQIAKVFKTWQSIPEICTIQNYATDDHYINALCTSIQKHISRHGNSQHFLFSFHGLPKAHIIQGDPYQEHCHATAKRVATQLNLPPHTWSIVFQSRLGRAQWLTPYTDKLLKSLPQQGHKHIAIICPGFSVDCLETLEEIAIRGKEQFLHSGGESFHYIPALNDSDEHVEVLKKIIAVNLSRPKGE